MHRERVTELLWPDRDPAAAANNFHQALYVARRAFEGAGGDAATICPCATTCSRSARAARSRSMSSFRGGRWPAPADAASAAAYRAALALHGGELLPEDRYEPWATGRREALGEAHLALLLELAGRLVDDGDPRARSRRSSGRWSSTRCTRRPTAR